MQEIEINYKEILTDIKEKEDIAEETQKKLLEVVKKVKDKYGSKGN